MTLLSSINAVCDIVAHDRFETVFGNEAALSFIQHANDATDEVSRRVDWSRMLKTVSVGTFPFPLPEDFQRLVPGGSVRVNGAYARPVTSSGEWAVVKQIPSAQPYYFMTGGAVEFSMTGGAVEFDYVTNTPVVSQDGTQGAVFVADDDSVVFPDRLLQLGILWRWKRQKGLPYDDQLAEFEAALVQEIKADRGSAL